MLHYLGIWYFTVGALLSILWMAVDKETTEPVRIVSTTLLLVLVWPVMVAISVVLTMKGRV